MFGDIITDEASVITGSMGMLPSASAGSGLSLYEPIHGSYPEVAGQNKANPMAAILSLAMMLEYSFDLHEEAKLINQAVEACIEEGILTEELSENQGYSTDQVGDAVSQFLGSENKKEAKTS
jgi:3-isopropylmalate dehydrogenase